METPSNLQDSLSEDEKVIVNWLKQNSIPIRHIEAGKGYADLQPLKSILKDVRVVGLGEATHGTRECYLLKHRLFEFLVAEMGFNTFILEASFSACQAINDYVLFGKGDRATLLTAQGFVVWDTEEWTEFLDWLRSYNKGVVDEHKVQFWGMDLWHNEFGGKNIIDYLQKVAPALVESATFVIEAITKEDTKPGFLIDEDSKKKLVQILPKLQELIDTMLENKNKFVRSSSQLEFDLILQNTQVMKQWVMVATAGLRPESQSETFSREFCMAENLLFWIDRYGPSSKFVVSAHIWHIQSNDELKIGPNPTKEAWKCLLRVQFHI